MDNLHRYIPYGTRIRPVRDHFYWTIRYLDFKYRTVFQLGHGKFTSLHTVRDSHSNRTGSLSFVHFEQHYTYITYGISIYTVRYVLFPASSSCSCQFLGHITTRNRPDLQVRDTGHSLLFVGLLGCPHWLFPHQYRHTPYGISTQIFYHRTVFLFLFFSYRTG